MVQALQSRGHVVAMTGDGVNDVLALKDADCGIAMASGSEATRAVAQLVLLDSTFSSLPSVLVRGSAGDQQHRARRQPVPRQDDLCDVLRDRHRSFSGAAVPVPPPPPDARRHVHDRRARRSSSRSRRTTRPRPTTASSVACCGSRCPVVSLASISTFVAYIIARNTRRGSRASHAGAHDRDASCWRRARSSILARVARPLVAWKIGMIAVMAAFLGADDGLRPAARLLRARRPARGTRSS